MSGKEDVIDFTSNNDSRVKILEERFNKFNNTFNKILSIYDKAIDIIQDIEIKDIILSDKDMVTIEEIFGTLQQNCENVSKLYTKFINDRASFTPTEAKNLLNSIAVISKICRKNKSIATTNNTEEDNQIKFNINFNKGNDKKE